MKSVFVIAIGTLVLSNFSLAASEELSAAYSRISKAKEIDELRSYDLKVTQFLLKLANKDEKLDIQAKKYISCLDSARKSSGLIMTIDAAVLDCANKYSSDLTKEECDLGQPFVGWRSSAAKLSITCRNARD